MQTIEKREEISYSEFCEQYLKKRIPVVFKNASKVWESNDYGPEFFAHHYGSCELEFEGKIYSVNQILELTKNSTPENPAPYPISFEIPDDLPDFMKRIFPLHMNYATPNWFDSKIFPYGKFGKNINLFFGGKGNQYSLHKDFYHTNAWITQLYGEKKFILFQGDQDEYLYAGKKGYSNFLSPVNILNPDLKKYPKYKLAKSVEVTLKAGETIFIPNGVWHTTIAPGQNISVIFDQLNSTNFAAWRRDMYEIKKEKSLPKAMMNYAFALTAGYLCKVGEVLTELVW